MRLATVCVALVVLGGCLPVPYSVADRPRVGGAVVLDGAVRAGVPVTIVTGHDALGRSKDCLNGETTTTDGQGAFHFDGHWHLDWPYPLIFPDCFVPWRLCFGDPAAPDASISWSDNGPMVRTHMVVCSVKKGGASALRFSRGPLPDPGSCWMQPPR